MTNFAAHLFKVGEGMDRFLFDYYTFSPNDPFVKMGESFLYSGLAVTAITGCVVSGVTVGAYAAVASIVYTIASPIFVQIADFFSCSSMRPLLHFYRVVLSNVVALSFFANQTNFPWFLTLIVVSEVYQNLVNECNNIGFHKAPLFIGPAHIFLY